MMLQRKLYYLLACTSLCRHHLKYAASAWETPLGYQIDNIEMVQHSAVTLTCNLKGTESVTQVSKDEQRGDQRSDTRFFQLGAVIAILK